MYQVFRTPRFEKQMLKALSLEQQQQVNHLETIQLALNPYVGDPLGYRFFREKKLGPKRVYYLIYEGLKAVLMVAISDKKAQQYTFNEIKNQLGAYYALV
ncbi:MAG TPA: hypothetical protein VJH22_04145 [Candidatus Nanoarchaeia archaeon]|nr:hypothetical protein [Candidatus Nanoarchaeia archaeon]